MYPFHFLTASAITDGLSGGGFRKVLTWTVSSVRTRRHAREATVEC